MTAQEYLRARIAVLLNINELAADSVAHALVKTLDREGYAIVPKEPTKAMRDAALDWCGTGPETWAAMLAAAPKVTL